VESAQPVTPALPPRNLIRVLTAFALLIVWYALASLMLSEAGPAISQWWSNMQSSLDHGMAPFLILDSYDPLISVFMVLGLTIISAIWTRRALCHSNGTTDRLAMLICLLCAISIPFDIVGLFVPEDFYRTFISVTMLLLTPLSYWVYRKLETKWTADHEIHPMAEGAIWPTDRHFWAATCFFFLLAWMMEMASLDDDLPENFFLLYGFLLPLAAACLVYRLGKRALK
jgi:hypothetical protein